jgi:hypothetical protein
MPSTGDDDNKVVPFPSTPEERRALQRAKQEAEQRRLVDLFVDEAEGGQTLFHTPDGDCYADLTIEGVRQTWPIRSKKFRAEYVRYLRRQSERLADASAPLAALVGAVSLRATKVNAAIDDFELRAVSSSVEREVHVRVARDGDHLYIDLCDAQWRAVRVTSSGWTVVENPPVRFRRTPDTRPLPFPERGESINTLRPFLSNLSEDDFIVVIAFLLAALQPNGPYPILMIHGEQGWAKTGLLRILRALTDPNKVMTAPLPASSRDLYVAARNSHIQAFENVSRLSDAISDSLCRLATGGGMRTRALWTNSDEMTFAGARPIMAEGIANFVTRPDLLDRSLILALESPPDRMTERQLWAEFDRRKAGIFGALCDMLAAGVRRLPETHLSNLPRMADFATWCAACGHDAFEAAYAHNRQDAVDTVLEHDLLAQSLKALVAAEGAWRGTCQELLDRIDNAARITDPRALSERLRRLAQPLRSQGISISHEPRKAKRREIVIALVGQ